jgi:hypothetical protein
MHIQSIITVNKWIFVGRSPKFPSTLKKEMSVRCTLFYNLHSELLRWRNYVAGKAIRGAAPRHLCKKIR